MVKISTFTPQINNLNPKPLYNGVSVNIGETPEHRAARPTIVKGAKKIPIALVGPSTHSQIYEEMVKLNINLTDCIFIHCGHGGQDIIDYLNLASAGWTSIKSGITNAGYTLADIKWMIFGTDDLHSSSNIFPAAPQSLSANILKFVDLAKTQMPNLKAVDLMSRINGDTITEVRFAEPSSYYTGFAHKFAVESTFATGHLRNGVWITDALNMWTKGETVRSDGLYIRYDWMQTNGGPHIKKLPSQGRPVLGKFAFDYCKRYPEFK